MSNNYFKIGSDLPKSGFSTPLIAECNSKEDRLKMNYSMKEMKKKRSDLSLKVASTFNNSSGGIPKEEICHIGEGAMSLYNAMINKRNFLMQVESNMKKNNTLWIDEFYLLLGISQEDDNSDNELYYSESVNEFKNTEAGLAIVNQFINSPSVPENIRKFIDNSDGEIFGRYLNALDIANVNNIDAYIGFTLNYMKTSNPNNPNNPIIDPKPQESSQVKIREAVPQPSINSPTESSELISNKSFLNEKQILNLKKEWGISVVNNQLQVSSQHSSRFKAFILQHREKNSIDLYSNGRFLAFDKNTKTVDIKEDYAKNRLELVIIDKSGEITTLIVKRKYKYRSIGNSIPSINTPYSVDNQLADASTPSINTPYSVDNQLADASIPSINTPYSVDNQLADASTPWKYATSISGGKIQAKNIHQGPGPVNQFFTGGSVNMSQSGGSNNIQAINYVGL